MGGPKGGPMKLTACFILFLSLAITPAIAQNNDNASSGPTGQWLLSLDEESRYFYITGTSAGLFFADEMIDAVAYDKGNYNKDRSFLFPKRKKLTYGQIFAIVEKYLNEHPESWGYPANGLIYQAIHEATNKMQ